MIISIITLFCLDLCSYKSLLAFLRSDDMAIVVGSLAKLFVGELVETCKY